MYPKYHLQFDKAMKDAYPLSPMPILRPPEDHGSRIPSNYKYKALPTSSSIRLLRLQPVDLASDNSSFTIFRPPILCSMITVDLDNTPLYDAVSYTWGDPCTIYTSENEISPENAWSSRPFDILVDGEPVSVGDPLCICFVSLICLGLIVLVVLSASLSLCNVIERALKSPSP